MPPPLPDSPDPDGRKATHRCRYRPVLELMARTWGDDLVACSRCGGRMRLVALVKKSQVDRQVPAGHRPVHRLPALGPRSRSSLLHGARPPGREGRRPRLHSRAPRRVSINRRSRAAVAPRKILPSRKEARDLPDARSGRPYLPRICPLWARTARPDRPAIGSHPPGIRSRAPGVGPPPPSNQLRAPDGRSIPAEAS